MRKNELDHRRALREATDYMDRLASLGADVGEKYWDIVDSELAPEGGVVVCDAEGRMITVHAAKRDETPEQLKATAQALAALLNALPDL